MKYIIILLFALSTSVHAQTPAASPDPSEAQAPDRGVWRAELPGGTFIAALSSITTVSTHEYVVDGSARVTEVSVGMIGSVQARFYFLEPNTPGTPDGIGQSTINFVQDKLTEAADRTGTDVWKKVVKKYPEATHAHTVEYRLDSKQTLAKLFKSLETAWMRGRGATFKP
ncbi:MAG: hypothetical protein ACOYNN_08000 [Terrimicrobiaceae bacterium]